MTKLWTSHGYGSPFFAIPTGVLLALAGIYGIYLNGLSLEIIFITLGGVVFIVGGVYALFNPDDDDD